MSANTRTPQHTDGSTEPFCWQGKTKLRQIRLAMDGRSDKDISSAILIYCILTEASSNFEGREAFEVTQAYVASLARVSLRTVQRRIPDLVAAGVIEYTVPDGLKTKGTVRILGSICHSVTPQSHNDTPQSHNVPPSCDFATCHALEENREETLEEKREERARARASFEKPTLEAVKTRAKEIGLAPNEAEKFFNYYESNGWHVGQNPMQNWNSALVVWKGRVRAFGNGNAQQPGQPPARRMTPEEALRNA